MSLFLVQHGESLPKDQDPEKGLSKKGIEETQKIAQVAKMYNIPVSQIVHSGKKRALQTAQIFHKELKIEAQLQIIEGIAPMDSVESYAQQIDSKANTMVVGHLPFMGKLVSLLTTGTIGFDLYRFQNSGIVCLEKEDDKWHIKWTLNPNIS